MNKLPGARFYEPVRPDGAQNKTLISNTDRQTLSNWILMMKVAGDVTVPKTPNLSRTPTFAFTSGQFFRTEASEKTPYLSRTLTLHLP